MGAGVDRFQRQRVVEVDVGDHRDRRFLDDRLQRLDVLLARHRAADDVGAGVGDLADLLHRRRQVGGLGLGHRLHGDRGAAADRHPADEYLALRSHGRSVPGGPSARRLEPAPPGRSVSQTDGFAIAGEADSTWAGAAGRALRPAALPASCRAAGPPLRRPRRPSTKSSSARSMPGGADNDSYVVLQAYTAGQNALGGHTADRLRPERQPRSAPSRSAAAVANGENQMTVLVADTAYAAGFPGGPAPDGTAPSFNLNPGRRRRLLGRPRLRGLGQLQRQPPAPRSGSPADPAGDLRRNGAAADRSPPAARPCSSSATTPTSASTDFERRDPRPPRQLLADHRDALRAVAAPNTTIGSPNRRPRRTAPKPSFTFTATPATGASFECKLDADPAFTACTSPASYTGLAVARGPATASRSGPCNPTSGTDPSPASHTWIVDTVAPVGDDRQPSRPDPSPGGSAAFTFHASETARAFECSLDAGGRSGRLRRLHRGSGPTPSLTRTASTRSRCAPPTWRATWARCESYSWTVDNSLADTTPPADDAHGREPPDPSASSTASFTYSSNEAGSTLRVLARRRRLRRLPDRRRSPTPASAAARTRFQVRAIDAEGNIDPTPAGYSFQVVLPVQACRRRSPSPLVSRRARACRSADDDHRPSRVRRRADRTPTFRFGSSVAGRDLSVQARRRAVQVLPLALHDQVARLRAATP